MNKLIVGIPHKDDFSSFSYMIDSFLKSTSAYDEIVILDGGSKFPEYLDTFNGGRKRVIKEKFDSSLEAYNYLFDLALKEKADLFLTQTDVGFFRLMNRDWLAEMREIAQSDDVGAVTCLMGGGVSGPDYVDKFNWLGAWCTYFPLRTLEKVGGYDKNFPNGFGVDIDHTYRIYKAGLRVALINYWVDHHMMNSRPHDMDGHAEEKKKASAEYFKQKWGLK